MNVKGLEIDFDITSPADVKRYKEAGEKMEAAGESITFPALPTDDPGFMDEYIEMLNLELIAFGNFLDDAFGEGVAGKLLGDNPSLNKIVDVNDALKEAMDAQSKALGVRLQKYQPNRAQRRAK
ncbi:MAG: hypothetical protein FWG40_00645 [Peptococcaceae bacterium]|nr:hypothetical protein [Peptococcaceae bacterium]